MNLEKRTRRKESISTTSNERGARIGAERFSENTLNEIGNLSLSKLNWKVPQI